MAARKKRRKWKPNRTQKIALAAAGTLVLILALVLLLFPGDGGVDVPAETVRTLPRNDFSPEDFSLVNGRMHYSGAYRQGIDISEHQENIDWNAVAEDGISFAIVRLGYRGTSEGGLFRDDQFHNHVVGAHSVGIETGAYFFSQATNVDEAIQEAEMALEIVDGYEMAYPIMFDWEPAENGRTADVGFSTILECAVAFCKRIEEGGYQAGFYFNLSMAENMRMVELEDYTLWLASYNDYPLFDYAFTFWQYSDAGSVSGIKGRVDLDLLFVEEDDPLQPVPAGIAESVP